ncbi:MAG: tetratricopeptide repeat protein, partial [Crocinitomicaceae bacterium]
MSRLIFFLFFAFPILIFAQNWNSTCDDFINEFNNNEFEKAIETGNRCLMILIDENGKDTSYCNVLYYLEYAHYYSESYEEAVKLAKEEVLIRREIQGESNFNYITACYNYSVFSTYTKDYNTAIHYMHVVLNYYKKEFGDESEYTLQIANQYGNILNLAGSSDLARQVYETSYEIIKKNYTIADSIFQAMTNTISAFYYSNGMFDLCEPFFTNALEYQEQAAGKESEVYRLTLESIVEFYTNAQKYDKLELIYREQLKSSAKRFGKNSADYATSLNNIAVTLENQDKLEEADELYQQALKLKAKIYKKESSFYALTLLNYGVLKYRMGQSEESEKYLLEALDIYEKVLSDNSSEYILTASRIAQVWQSYGELGKAKESLEKSIAIAEKNFGKENLDYVVLIEILGGVLLDKGDFKGSEKWLNEAIQIRAKIQGIKHPDYISTQVKLARLKSTTGDNEAAENLLRNALKIRKESLGELNMDVASCYSELANVMFAQGNVEEAKYLHFTALQTVKKLVGDMHPDYLVYLSNVGILYMEIGELDQALALFNEALQKQKLAQGEEAYDLHFLHTYLGNLYIKKGDFKSAETAFGKCLKILENSVGKEHPEYANTINSMGVLYYQLGNYKKAEKYYAESIPLYQKIYGKEHPEYATICSNIGSLYMQMGGNTTNPSDQKLYWDQAEKFMEKVLQIDSATLRTNHPDFAIHLNNMAELNRYRNRADEAEKYYLATIKLEEELYGKTSFNSIATLNNMALFYLGSEKLDKAKQCAEKASQAYTDNFGENALVIPSAWSTLAYIHQRNKENEKAMELHQKILEKQFHIVKDNFSFLSEEEKANYLEDFQGHRNNFFQFLNETDYRDEKAIELAYTISLFEKGLLLKSTQEMKTKVLNSGNEELLAKYEHWIGLKQELAQLYSEPNFSESQQISLQERCDELEKQLVEATGIEQVKEVLSMQSVLNQLEENQIAIEFIEHQNSFYLGENEKFYSAVIVGKGIKTTYIELFKADDLEKVIGKVGMNNVTYVNELYGTKTQIEKELYHLIWSKIDSVIKEGNQIFYAPSGLLNKIAFAGLRDENGKYLSDKYQLNQLSST